MEVRTHYTQCYIFFCRLPWTNFADSYILCAATLRTRKKRSKQARHEHIHLMAQLAKEYKTPRKSITLCADPFMDEIKKLGMGEFCVHSKNKKHDESS